MAQRKSVHDFLERSALPILIIILIPIGLAIYAYWNSTTNPSQSQAPATTPAATTAAPQPAATIFLDDPSALPQTVPAGQFIPFSFTIQNTGGVGGSIPYRVSVKWSTGEEDVIDENVVALSGGASTTIDENLKFEIATETAEVYLELPQTGQNAQFALPRAQ